MAPEDRAIEVRLWGTLRDLIGSETVTVEAGTIREMLDALAADHPALERHLKDGVSVSVDGAIHNGSWFKPLQPGQEIVVLPRIKGG